MSTESENKETMDFIICLDCTDRLKVPEAHPWNTGTAIRPDTVILKDKKENTWRVELKITDDQVCFIGGGWSKFVQDNNVKVSNFIVFFEINAPRPRNVFAVRLFDSKTRCVTGGFSGMKFVITDDDDEDEDEDDNNYKAVKKNKMRSIKDIYAYEIFTSRGFPLPQNPYIITRKGAMRERSLYMPAKVIADYKIELPTKTMMRDKKGNEWETILTKWEDGRLRYCGGWASFCRVNGVKEDEDCICEFVKDSIGNQGLTLLVYKMPI